MQLLHTGTRTRLEGIVYDTTHQARHVAANLRLRQRGDIGTRDAGERGSEARELAVLVLSEPALDLIGGPVLERLDAVECRRALGLVLLLARSLFARALLARRLLALGGALVAVRLVMVVVMVRLALARRSISAALAAGIDRRLVVAVGRQRVGGFAGVERRVTAGRVLGVVGAQRAHHADRLVLAHVGSAGGASAGALGEKHGGSLGERGLILELLLDELAVLRLGCHRRAASLFALHRNARQRLVAVIADASLLTEVVQKVRVTRTSATHKRSTIAAMMLQNRTKRIESVARSLAQSINNRIARYLPFD